MSDFPESWRLSTLADVGEWKGGGTPSKANPAYWKGEIPWASPKDMKSDIIRFSEDSISEIAISESSASLIPAGAILVVTRSGILRHTLPLAVAGRDLAINQDLKAITVKPGIEDSYVFQYMKSNSQDILDSCMKSGTTVESIETSLLKNFPIPLPPLPEQQKIAEILSGIDKAIEKLIHKSQKLDALQASLTEELVQELQGKMDLAELQEHAEVRTGVAKNAKSEGDMTEMPYMRVANVQDGYLDLSEIKTISIDRGRIQRYLLQSGDVLINEGGDLDKVGRGVIWRGEIKECLHQNHVFAVRCSERLTPEFLSLLLKSAYSKNYFLGCAKQTTNLASINSTQLKQFPIPVPDLRTQGQFISNITAVKELNSAITSEISGLEATKKAVASDLLSGRKRVSV